MIRKLSLLTAFGAGYVLGARAGKDRYDQIAAGVQDLAATPAVQKVTGAATAKAHDLADSAKDKAKDKVTAAAGEAVATVKERVSHGGSEDQVLDLGGPDPASATPAATGPTTGPLA